MKKEDVQALLEKCKANDIPHNFICNDPEQKAQVDYWNATNPLAIQTLAQNYLDALEVLREINLDYVTESLARDCPGCDYDGLMPDNMKHHSKCVYKLSNDFLKKVGIEASETKVGK